MIRRVALLAALAGACSADPDACWFGNDRSAGGACALPELAATIDGDAAEWDDATIYRWRACYQCPDGDVDSLQLARQGSDALVLRAVTNGPPISDGSATYLIGFRPLYDAAWVGLRAYAFEVLFAGDQVDGRMKPWYEFTGLPVELAWTANGFEMRIPTDVLPFEGGAWFNAGAADGTSGGSIARVCWVPSASDDACAFNHE